MISKVRMELEAAEFEVKSDKITLLQGLYD